MCTQMWRDDDGELHFCDEERGHGGECICSCGLRYCETVAMVPPVKCSGHPS
jgi:hypothetical protein